MGTIEGTGVGEPGKYMGDLVVGTIVDGIVVEREKERERGRKRKGEREREREKERGRGRGRREREREVR